MYESRIKTIDELKPDFEVLKLAIKDSGKCVLQEDINAEMDMPPFNKSAMDGYACRWEDLESELSVKEVIPAGKIPQYSLKRGECSKIMTGAAIPENADCVFKVEDSKSVGENKVICTDLNSKRNICLKGEDFHKGDILLKKGLIIGPEHIAVMAANGLQQVKVSKSPKIGILVTGSELVEPGEILPIGKIRNSNALQIISLLDKMGFNADYYGIAKDDFDLLQNKIHHIIEKNDLTIVTGGASMGDFDFIPDIIEKLGFKLLWNRTGLKPGNPMSFGVKQNKYFVGLSGNPVSSLVQFEFLTKNIIYKLLGASYYPFRIKAILAEDFKRKSADRLGIIPVHVNAQGMIESIPFNGSAHINGLAMANALLEFPEGSNELKNGSHAFVRPI